VKRDPYMPRRGAAALLTDEYFQVSERTLLEWREVPLVYLNGRAHARESDWRRAAAQRLRDQLSRQGADDVPALRAAARVQAATGRRRGNRLTAHKPA
jgi:hypothetical protein